MNTHPFIWSIRRELWENRFLVIAPMAVAVLVLAAYLTGTLHLAQLMSMHAQTDDGHAMIVPQGLPFSVASGSVLVTGMLTAIFYCLGALYNDRRDRSILFWKSLPVSDRAIVFSKASIALIVLPAIIFVITLAMQLLMLALSAAYALTHAGLAPAFWVQWPFIRMGLVLIYGLATLALWHAPVYGWLLMVSAWARRAPFLWAVIPPLALCIAEKIAFGSSLLSGMLLNRLFGAFDAGFSALAESSPTDIQLSQLTPLKFLETPQLWTGLLFTAAFLIAAIRLRRLRGPI